MRALEPTAVGYATNPEDGTQIAYEIFGSQNEPRTIVLLPTWSLIHSRFWKMQIPYFAGHGYRVVTFDGRGNGRSERPESGYTTGDFTRDTQAVFDVLGIDQAALVGLSAGARWGIQFAAQYPDRVTHLVLIAPAVRLEGNARRNLDDFLSEPPDREGWNKYNAVHWRENYRDFVEWFVSEIFSEPHSSKPNDDFVDWAMETTPGVLIATTLESPTPRMAEFATTVACPTLIIQGDDDRITSLAISQTIHEAIAGSELVVIEGGGHAPNGRDPVKINLSIHEFLNRHHDQTERLEASDASG